MQLDQQIAKATVAYRSYVLANSYLQKLKQEVEQERVKLQGITIALQKSQSKLSQFENTGELEKFINSLLDKNPDELLEIERDYYYELILKYKNAKKFIDGASFDIQVLEEKVQSGATLKEQLNQLIQQRKESLENSSLEDIEPIIRLTQKIGERIGLRTEIEEAIDGGRALINAIKETHNYLLELKQDLKEAGRFDSLIGIRLTRLDNLQQLAINCKKLLIAYEDEILDIYEYINIPNAPKLREGNEFIDEYFEALTTDHLLGLGWKTSANYLDVIMNKITRIQMALEKDLRQVKEQLQDMESKRDEIVKDIKL